MKTIKVVKSFEDAFISASKTDNMKWVKVLDSGRIMIFGITHDYWPAGKEAIKDDFNSYKVGSLTIPEWALEDETVSSIPEDIKAINQLMLDFDCTSIPCCDCVFHDNRNRFCMITQIRRQTDDKYPGFWE